MSILESKYYRRQHVTGPGCVLVSIKFGKSPENGMRVLKRVGIDKDSKVTFDIDRHVAEVVSGVHEATEKFGGSLEVEEIEVVPDDYPQKGQAKYAAFQIAEHVIKNGT